jgi:hypothetical protein
MIPLLFCAFASLTLHPAAAQGDSRELHDPERPVMRLGKTTATLQWFTRTPTETRLQLRPGSAPCNTPQKAGQRRDVWKSPSVLILQGPPGKRAYHRLTLTGLKPGTRYTYRIYDPAIEPTGLERRWGAEKPWRREFSFSTLAPAGRKTLIRIPVKVLLMPNVINVASAHDATGVIASQPSKLTAEQMAKIRREYQEAARFLFVNNGMRVWFDFQIFVDDRWQRWGEEPSNAGAFYRGLPVCRSYPGRDFAPPGGGDFTIVDTGDLTRANRQPVFEKTLYVGQIEQAFTRRWNRSAGVWEFYRSGGGTLGIDGWDQGIPARSQYLGGDDTAWLATHEFHHQMESFGAFSFGNNENDRIIFDHFFPRKRERRPDGTYEEWTWNTSWRHGEHWDGIAYFDRMLTPVQWLRLHFGETITVADRDEDGVPDDDPRLPLDEKRFGSDPGKTKTDGVLNDLQKIMLSSWAPAPLTSTWTKADYPRVMPSPRKTDSDGDGLTDEHDPYPLYPWQPFIWNMRAEVDGRPDEWREIPLSGSASRAGTQIAFRQGCDNNAYYACFEIRGDWQRISVGLDGEGAGYYSTSSTYALEISPSPENGLPVVRPTSGNRCPGMLWKSGRSADGTAVVEISIPNRGEGLWFWTGGGRDVGAAISLWTKDGKPLSVYEPYDLFYARMLEGIGKNPPPPGAPAELMEGAGVYSADFSRSSEWSEWRHVAGNWELRDGALRFVRGEDGENYLYREFPPATEFDIWVEFEARNDMHIGAWTAEAKQTDNMTDYVAFLGGFGNARSVIRTFGAEGGAEESGIGPGRHTMQLSRREGRLWLLYDGKPIAWSSDPQPKRAVTRLGFLGGWGGEQAIYRIRIRAGNP